MFNHMLISADRTILFGLLNGADPLVATTILATAKMHRRGRNSPS